MCDPDDEALLCSVVRGEFNLSGLQNKTLRRHLPKLKSGQVSRLLKRLRTHGLIKKIGRTYKYYATAFGKQAVATALKLRELVILPQLALAPAPKPDPATTLHDFNGEVLMSAEEQADESKH